MHKRAHYLAVLAYIFKKSDLGLSCHFEAFQGDLRRPILILNSKGSSQKDKDHFSASGFSIRIFPTVSSDLFGPSKLAPARNNIRSATQPPTPHYNACILMDTCPVSHLNFLHRAASQAKDFKDAIIFGKVWLAQRFSKGQGFNGFLWSMIMAHLLQSTDARGVKKLSNDFSSYQLFKITMEFLGIFSCKYLQVSTP